MKRITNFFTVKRAPEGKIFWNGKLNKPLVGTQVKIRDNEYDLTAESLKAIDNTNYTFESMVAEDLVNFAEILQSVN